MKYRNRWWNDVLDKSSNNNNNEDCKRRNEKWNYNENIWSIHAYTCGNDWTKCMCTIFMCFKRLAKIEAHKNPHINFKAIEQIEWKLKCRKKIIIIITVALHLGPNYWDESQPSNGMTKIDLNCGRLSTQMMHTYSIGNHLIIVQRFYTCSHLCGSFRAHTHTQKKYR